MTIDDRISTFAGLPVYAWDRELGYGETLPDPAAVAWRLDIDDYEPHEEAFAAAFETLLEMTGPTGPTALIIGQWGGAYVRAFPMDLLIRNAARLTGLRALFIGEITAEECEVSWIKLDDVTPVLKAFPALERLWVRGSDGLNLAPVRHEGLRELVVQSAGLPARVVRAICASDLPNVTDLELWLGTGERGRDTRPEDLEPILAGRTPPALTRLGLRNGEDTDWFVDAVAAAPVVARLTELDLSLGTLGDEGGEALLAGQPLTHLKVLNLSHHFMSPEMAQRLVDELPGVFVDVSDWQERDEDDEEDDWRYVAVDE
jgi:hypothetical protein